MLIHCLAGAHRAGTAGVACLMHLCDLDMQTAVTIAQTARPAINPIGDFPKLLSALDRARKRAASGARPAAADAVRAQLGGLGREPEPEPEAAALGGAGAAGALAEERAAARRGGGRPGRAELAVARGGAAGGGFGGFGDSAARGGGR